GSSIYRRIIVIRIEIFCFWWKGRLRNVLTIGAVCGAMRSRKENAAAVDRAANGRFGPGRAQLASLARNVANQRWAEEALLQSEARYRIVAETAIDAIVTIGEDGEILFANGSAERIFGYTIADMLARKLTLL